MSYPLYQPTIAAASAHAGLLRLILGIVTVFAVSILWMLGVLWLVTRTGVATLEVMRADEMGLRTETPEETLIVLSLIFGLGVGTWVAARFWQKRGLRSLMGRGAVVLRHFVVAAAVTWGVALLFLALPVSDPVLPNLDIRTWIHWLPLALVFVAFQTGSEELLFRGYLQSQLAARFRHPVLWLVFPAFLFGAAHFLPTLPFSAGLAYVIFAALFGLMAGDLTARTGSIGAAWGFHFANNSMAILIIAVDGSLSGLGLYRRGDLAEALSLSPLALLDLAGMLVVWLLIRRLLTV